MSFATTKSALPHARIWHHVSAEGRVFGRLAVNIALALSGKYKPVYDGGVDCGDYVVVTDIEKVILTGRKASQKVYRYHTRYPGGWKEIPYQRFIAKHPTEAIKKAVKRMLPKNRLRDIRMSRLKVFVGPDHPYKENIFREYDGTTVSNKEKDNDGQEELRV